MHIEILANIYHMRVGTICCIIPLLKIKLLQFSKKKKKCSAQKNLFLFHQAQMSSGLSQMVRHVSGKYNEEREVPPKEEAVAVITSGAKPETWINFCRSRSLSRPMCRLMVLNSRSALESSGV